MSASSQEKLRTSVELDGIIEADQAALRFAEKFDIISRELRDSLHRERALLDECRRICENSMAQTRGLEMAMIHAQLDATELDELRARIVDAERVADEARSKERNAKELVHKKMDEIQTWKDLLKEATEQAAKLRNVITAQAAKEKPKVTIKKLGSQATPFEDWKHATGRVTLSSGEGANHRAHPALSPAQLRKLGHVPQDELDRMRENVRSTVKVVVGGGGGGSGIGGGGGGVSGPPGGGGGASAAASPLRLAGGRTLQLAATAAAAAAGGAGGPESPADNSGTKQQQQLQQLQQQGGSAVPRFLEIEPHPLFPAHLYLSPQSKRPEQQDTPLSVGLLTGATPTPAAISSNNNNNNKDGLGGLLADYWQSDEDDKGGRGGGSAGGADGGGGLEDRNALLMASAVEKSRASVLRMFARIEAREEKIKTLRLIKEVSSRPNAHHHPHHLFHPGGVNGEGSGFFGDDVDEDGSAFNNDEESEAGADGESGIISPLVAQAFAAIGPPVAPAAAFSLTAVEKPPS